LKWLSEFNRKHVLWFHKHRFPWQQTRYNWIFLVIWQEFDILKANDTPNHLTVTQTAYCDEFLAKIRKFYRNIWKIELTAPVFASIKAVLKFKLFRRSACQFIDLYCSHKSLNLTAFPLSSTVLKIITVYIIETTFKIKQQPCSIGCKILISMATNWK